MRFACFGWVAEEAGSGPSAHFLVLKELLARGCEIDLYANEGFLPSPKGLGGSGFRYLGFAPPRVLRELSGNLEGWIQIVAPPVSRAVWRRVFEPTARTNHRQRPYDAVLSLGPPPPFTLHDTPTITWVSGPLRSELDAIVRLRHKISEISGRAFWCKLATYYAYRSLFESRVLKTSDLVLCGSQWSRRTLIAEGMEPDRVHAIPYPVDLDVFRPATSSVNTEGPVLLALGRLDPRKRLDLLLDAFAIVLQAVPDARLRVVGAPGHAPRMLALLERFPERHRVVYLPPVSRAQVPTLLREAAVLVQASENENFGTAVPEALACGVPVVVGSSNGTADYIDENSGIFESYEPAQLAYSVTTVLERWRRSPDDVSRTARAAAEKHFRSDVVCDRLLELVVATRRRRSSQTGRKSAARFSS